MIDVLSDSRVCHSIPVACDNIQLRSHAVYLFVELPTASWSFHVHCSRRNLSHLVIALCGDVRLNASDHGSCSAYDSRSYPWIFSQVLVFTKFTGILHFIHLCPSHPLFVYMLSVDYVKLFKRLETYLICYWYGSDGGIIRQTKSWSSKATNEVM